MKLLLLAFVLMVSVGAMARSERARPTAVRADLYGGIRSALDQFAVDCGRYPTTSEGLAALMNCPTHIASGRWRGPYLDKMLIDPWGHEYVYRWPGIHNTNGFDLYSCGYDGLSKSGGDDLDDINNWDPGSPHGGNDNALNYFHLKYVFFVGLWLLVLIPFSGGIRLISSLFSQRVRDSIARYPTAHLIWFVLSLVAIIFLLLLAVPRIA